MDSRFITTAFSGTSTLRNTASSSRKLSSRTTPISTGIRPPRYVEKSVDAAVRPPTLAVTPGAGMTSSRRCVHERGRGRVLGRARGVHDHDGKVAVDRRRHGERNPVGRFEPAHEPVERGRVGRCRPLDVDEHRPVHAGAEALGDEVVGPPAQRRHCEA
jgi:hypothetical protein